MGLIELIVYIAVMGLLVWAITSFVPMPEKFKQAIYVIAVVVLVVFVLQQFGLFHGFHDIKIPGTR